MMNLEDRESWPDILRCKDTLSLREISLRFGVSPGEISAAFKRAGVARVPVIGASDALPPEPGDPQGVLEGLGDVRPGSKDGLITEHMDLLGKVPDAEIASLAGVSMRTVASFRARHGVPGYRGPRRPAGKRTQRRSRVDPFAELLGNVPDRVVAEKAGVSLNAVRNYRNKRGIAAAGRARSDLPASAEVALAWRVTWRSAEGEEVHGVLVAADLVHAATRAVEASLNGEVVALSLVGPLID
jgi:hypothetical protein